MPLPTRLALLRDPHLGLSSDDDRVLQAAAADFLCFAVADEPAAQSFARRKAVLPLLSNPLQSSDEDVVHAACTALSALVQHNRACQIAARDAGVLEQVLGLLISSTHERVIIGAATALGALTNGHGPNQAFVHAAGGVGHLVSRAAYSTFLGVRMRALYALSCLAAGNSMLRDDIVNTGGIQAAVALLLPSQVGSNVSTPESNRYSLLALAALRGFISRCSPTVTDECRPATSPDLPLTATNAFPARQECQRTTCCDILGRHERTACTNAEATACCRGCM